MLAPTGHTAHPDTPIVAAAQLAPLIGDPVGNRALAAGAIDAAAAAGASLIVLPELCISGYVFDSAEEARELAEPLDGQTVEDWRERSQRGGIVVVGGICELGADGALYNSAVVIDGGALVAVHRKTHLWDREQLIFTPGDQAPAAIETSAGRVGIAICYEAFFPEFMRALALAGADVIAVPMNSPVEGPAAEPLAIEIVIAIAAAHVNRVFVAQADRCGSERGVRWAQASAICGCDGTILAGPLEGPGLLMAPFEAELARDKSLGGANNVITDRRPEIYSPIPSPTPTTT